MASCSCGARRRADCISRRKGIPFERVSKTARTAEEWVSLGRVLVLLGLIPASWLGLLTAPRRVVDAVMVVLGGYVLLLALGPRKVPILRKVDLIVVLDLGVVTLIVLVSGSASSPFLYLYYLIILEAACRFNLRQAMAASMAMASVTVLLWLREGHPEAFETVGFRLGAFAASGFFLALLLGVLVQEYRTSHDRVQELMFDNELATRLAGELRVNGVAELLLQRVLGHHRSSQESGLHPGRFGRPPLHRRARVLAGRTGPESGPTRHAGAPRRRSRP